MNTSLTVFFEDPFWVGVFERIEDDRLSVCKVTFGAEPKDYEVWEYILQHYHELVFSPAVEAELRQAADNPKRRSRNARKQLENTGIGTKSQQALQRQLPRFAERPWRVCCLRYALQCINRVKGILQ